MIVVDHLSVKYGAVQALSDISFVAETGQITAIIGANGAGKTSLLRTISGLVKPESGTISFAENSLVGKRPEDIARLGVGHVPEGHAVIASFTIEENLRLGSFISPTNFEIGLEAQFARFPPLRERRKQPASSLSGGERQMLAMARALISEPRVLLLDEPSLGLAPLITQELMRTIQDLCTTDHLTVLLVEQNAKSALRIAHRAVVLQVGRVVANDSSDAISADTNLRGYYLGGVN